MGRLTEVVEEWDMEDQATLGAIVWAEAEAEAGHQVTAILAMDLDMVEAVVEAAAAVLR